MNLEKSHNQSGYKHVYAEGSKWKAMVKENGKLLDLGIFELPRLAAIAAAEYKKSGNSGLLRKAVTKKRRAAVSDALAREVAACQRWQCTGRGCPLPDERGNLPAEFEIDHINGDCSDNRMINLQALCGICHNKKSSLERQQRLARKR